MDSVKRKHLAAANRNFLWCCQRQGFSPSEQHFLNKWGSWLEALWSGEIAPFTAAQHWFVSAARDQLPCQTFSQDLWRRYLIASGKQEFTNESQYTPREKPCDNLDLSDCEYMNPDDSSALAEYRESGGDCLDLAEINDDIFDDGEDIGFAMEEGFWPDSAEEKGFGPVADEEEG